MNSDTAQHRNSFSYINPKLRLGQSHIEGRGYFASEQIKKNEKLIVQSGQCVHVSDIDRSEMEPYWYYGFQIESDVYLYPLNFSGEAHVDGIFKINHSCEPNAGFVGQITLVAMRDIEVGEEITYDYAMTDVETSLEAQWSPETCACGSKNCRLQITGDDWKIPELQEKYAGFFSTHVTKAISTPSSDGATL